jgi:MFS family permease
MTTRWGVLAVLTFARTAMGFQFQTVAALSVPLLAEFQLTYAGLGTLVGLYLFPGVVVAVPGGLIAQRFGDKRVVCAGIAAMVLGSMLMALAQNTAMLNVGRILSGCGAVFLNVLVTKMVTDWFQGKEIVTALGVLITSWPLGIAIALVAVPALAAASSWQAGMWSAAITAAVALAFVALVYRSPPGATKPAEARFRFDLNRRELALAILSGLVWTFYNMGLILLLTFGPAWLVSAGESSASASALISILSWIILPAIPLGAMVAERLRQPMTIMLSCFALAAVCIWVLPSVGGSVALLAAIGIIFGPPGGLIMALPGHAAPQERRALAMGVYFTCYYLGMGVVPGVAGFARDATNNPAAPIYVAAAMLILACVSLLLFRVIQVRGMASEARAS